MVCSAQITYTFCIHLGWYLNQNCHSAVLTNTMDRLVNLVLISAREKNGHPY